MLTVYIAGASNTSRAGEDERYSPMVNTISLRKIKYSRHSRMLLRSLDRYATPHTQSSTNPVPSSIWEEG